MRFVASGCSSWINESCRRERPCLPICTLDACNRADRRSLSNWSKTYFIPMKSEPLTASSYRNRICPARVLVLTDGARAGHHALICERRQPDSWLTISVRAEIGASGWWVVGRPVAGFPGQRRGRLRHHADGPDESAITPTPPGVKSVAASHPPYPLLRAGQPQRQHQRGAVVGQPVQWDRNGRKATATNCISP